MRNYRGVSLEAQAVAHAGVQVAVFAVEFVAGIHEDGARFAAQRDGEPGTQFDTEDADLCGLNSGQPDAVGKAYARLAKPTLAALRRSPQLNFASTRPSTSALRLKTLSPVRLWMRAPRPRLTLSMLCLP